jgi:hypothetical protein
MNRSRAPVVATLADSPEPCVAIPPARVVAARPTVARRWMRRRAPRPASS